MQKFLDEIQAHPLVVALVVFGVFFIIFNVFKKNSTTATSPAGLNGKAPAPGGGDTYAQQFTSYPVYSGPVIQQNQPPPPGAPPPPTPRPPDTPGKIYPGPTGVLHYLTPGGETLRQIASKLGVGTWNAIYAIPNNQKAFGAMDSAHAAVYKPSAGLYITVPGNSKVG